MDVLGSSIVYSLFHDSSRGSKYIELVGEGHNMLLRLTPIWSWMALHARRPWQTSGLYPQTTDDVVLAIATW